MPGSPASLDEVLDRVCDDTGEDERVSVGRALDAIGRRSFGPLLLVAGLVVLAPLIGDIPGVPTLVGLAVVVLAVQLLAGRDHFWLPQWIERRSAKRERVQKALRWMRRPARFTDRLLRPRLTALTGRNGERVTAIACVALALATPAMEVVPFSANLAGAAFCAFGLSLLARDGLMALAALLCTAALVAVLIYNLI